MRRAENFACVRAGSMSAARIAITPITTSNSTNVNARRALMADWRGRDKMRGPDLFRCLPVQMGNWSWRATRRQNITALSSGYISNDQTHLSHLNTDLE